MHRNKSASLLTIAIAATALAMTLPTVSLADYETPAYIDIELGEVRVHEPAGTVTIHIIRSGDFRRTTTVEYQTVEDNASEGEDFKGAGGTLVFRPGEGFKTVVLEIIRDEHEEALESFRFEVTSSDPNCMLMRSSSVVVIEDAPTPIAQPELQIASAGNGQIVLSWEGSDACALERTTAPSAGDWERVECAPTLSGNRCEVIQPVGGSYFFYRLRVP